MSKVYKRGNYHIKHFGFYGEKLGESQAESLHLAEAEADKHDTKEIGNNSVILRVIKNTKDNITSL